MLGDRARGGEEPLSLARGLEPLPASLALAGGVVRVLGTVIQIPVLEMFHTRKSLSLGGPVTFKFVGDDHARDIG